MESMEPKRWSPRDGVQEMASKRLRPRDGIQEMASKRWRPRDGVQEMASKRWHPRDGVQEIESKVQEIESKRSSPSLRLCVCVCECVLNPPHLSTSKLGSLPPFQTACSSLSKHEHAKATQAKNSLDPAWLHGQVVSPLFKEEELISLCCF